MAGACAGKTLTPRIMVQVEQAFQQVFGPYAGWAHNTLFISELASMRHRLPDNLVEPTKRSLSQPDPAPEAAAAPSDTASVASNAPPKKRKAKAAKKSKQSAAPLLGRTVAQQLQEEAAALRADPNAEQPSLAAQDFVGEVTISGYNDTHDCGQVHVNGCQMVDPEDMGLPPGFSFTTMDAGLPGGIRRNTVKVAQPG